MIVGAAGHFCPVARELNRAVSDTSTIVAQEIEFELDANQAASCPVRGVEPELYFWPDFAGYGWCVRKGAFLNVGAGRLAPLSLPNAIHEFTALLERRGDVLPEDAAKVEGARLPSQSDLTTPLARRRRAARWRRGRARARTERRGHPGRSRIGPVGRRCHSRRRKRVFGRPAELVRYKKSRRVLACDRERCRPCRDG